MSKTSTFLKRLGGASMAVAGILGTVNTAQAAVASNGLGDLAIVPYYTVQNNFITGVHITNVTDSTQVVKFRLRRDSDSADVLDFNVIMSPYDVFTGWLDDSEGTLRFYTSDNSCTAPALASGLYHEAPAANREGAEEGYIEIIGMAETIDEDQQIAEDAKHINGAITEAKCDNVRDNFFAGGVIDGARGVIDNDTTTDGDNNESEYQDTNDQALKVSFFIRDTNSGMEFGGDALHIQGFGASYAGGHGVAPAVAGVAMMTNQQLGLETGSTSGFDFPDLDGGGANIAAPASLRGRYNDVIRAAAPTGIGATEIINDWSYNTANGVSTDWVVTIPGQYLMNDPSTNNNDNRDLPLNVTVGIYDREEGSFTAEPGTLTVSPGVPDEENVTSFGTEVNVVEWGTATPVFGSDAANNVQVLPAAGSGGLDDPYGWATLTVASANTNARLVYDLSQYDSNNPDTSPPSIAATGNVPMVGFVAWKRTFDNADRNYGRIIPHSFR